MERKRCRSKAIRKSLGIKNIRTFWRYSTSSMIRRLVTFIRMRKVGLSQPMRGEEVMRWQGALRQPTSRKRACLRNEAINQTWWCIWAFDYYYCLIDIIEITTIKLSHHCERKWWSLWNGERQGDARVARISWYCQVKFMIFHRRVVICPWRARSISPSPSCLFWS